MNNYLLRKIGWALFTVAFVVVLNFFLFRILPGDPARAVRDPRARVDAAGFGLLLMHRSVVAPMRQRHPGQSLFGEIEAAGDAYASEDIQFFRRLKATGIPLHAHTGAVAKHMKRYALDAAYYRLYWNAAAAQQPPGRGS